MALLEILRQTTSEELIYGNRITTVAALIVILFAGYMGFRLVLQYIDRRVHPEKAEAQIYFDAELSLQTAKVAAAALIVADAMGTIVFINPQLTEILHWQQHEMIGKNLDMIIKPESRVRHNEGMRQWRETGYSEMFNKPIRATCLMKGDIEIPVEITIKQMIVHNKPFVVGKIRDLRKQLEEIETIKRECSRENDFLRKEVDWYRKIERECGGGMMEWLYSKDRVIMSLGMQASTLR